jgi:tetratricopeptide (TPR) repeat protein
VLYVPTDLDSAKNPVCWLVPFQRNENFVGRVSQLHQLEDGLFVDGCFSKMALFALGGMGKTSIALQLAYRIREQHPTYSVFWVTATSPESFEQSYRKIGQMLALPGIEDNNANVKTLVRDYLNDEEAGRWFMILDNADDPYAWFQRSNTDAPRLADYVPRSRHGCALLTTRNQQIATKFARRSVVEVVEMDRDASMQLLKNILIREEILRDFEDTRQLLEQLCYLPLAIVQAGAYLNMNNNVTISDYLSFLNDTEGSLVETLSEDFEDDWRYQNQQNPVVTTWIVSFEQIRQQKPLAADYLSLLSYIQPKAIPKAFFPPAPSTKQQLEAISYLTSYSFLSQQVGNSFDMHRLVHIATRNWLKKTQNHGRYYKEVISRWAEIFPTSEHENRDIWRTYFLHIKFTLSLNQEQTGIDRELLTRYGLCLLSDGRYDDAELPLTDVVEVGKQILGINHPNTLSSMANLASTYRHQGRWTEAEELFVQVIETRKRELGSEHPDTLTSMGNLASTFQNQGRWTEAEELKVQVMETMKRVVGPEHPDTLTSMGNLASTFKNQGRWIEAEELEMQVMETGKRVLGPKHHSTLTSIGNLASIFRNQGRWTEAEELEVQVMETMKRVLGPEHPDTLTSMGNLASTFRHQGRWTEAEELEVQVMETMKRVLGPEHPDTLTSMANLALTFRNQGRWTEAEELKVQVMETRTRVLGPEHPSTLTSMANLALTWRSLGRREDAMRLMETSFQLREIKLGPNHPDTKSSLEALTDWRAADSEVDDQS